MNGHRTVKLNLRRGADLQIKGGVDKEICRIVRPSKVAISTDDFPGLTLKAEVTEGDIVNAFSPLLHDKDFPEIKLTSPSAGTVERIERGQRRRIERVVIRVNTSSKAFILGTSDFQHTLQQTGLWAQLRQRPYDIVPRPGIRPRDIFVTAIDSAPLAPDMVDTLKRLYDSNWIDFVSKGIELLSEQTDGDVYISYRRESLPPIPHAVMVEVNGPHPSGNAGIQAANIKPVNKGEVIWTLDLRLVAAIGQLFTAGLPDEAKTEVAVVGPMVKNPMIVSTLIGSEIESLIKDNIVDNGQALRIISGNVLTGHNVGRDGWLRRPYSQVTVIADGCDHDEFLGWAALNNKDHSFSRSFFSWLTPRHKFAPDARIHGGRRAMIMSGVYDSMMPADIMVEPLVKAILGRDIEKMEQLGIYEVAPEDFALAEYADPSKLELQRIVREGLDYMIKEG